jgi:hypothetical protein
MLPHDHALLAAAVITPAVLIAAPGTLSLAAAQVATGAAVAAVIDLDVLLLVYLKGNRQPRLQPFRNPLRIVSDFDRFMDIVQQTGLRKLVHKTHLLMSAIILVSAYFYLPSFFLATSLGVASHLVSDFFHWRRLGDILRHLH